MTHRQGRAHDEKIIEFCKDGKTMEEIAEHVGVQRNTVANYVARLKIEERLKKITPKMTKFRPGGVVCFFITPGTELTHAPLHYDEPPVEVDPKWNEDFIRVAHRCLFLESA